MIYDERTLRLWKIGWPVATVTALLGLELIARYVFPAAFDGVGGLVLLVVIWSLLMALGAHIVMGSMAESNRLLIHQNRELLALHHASLAIQSQVDLDTLLRRIVEESRDVLSAKYGGLSYFRENGDLANFITIGFDHPEGMLPTPPEHGVIGAVTKEGGVLRLDDVSAHPMSVGFPEGHPDMKPLLAVPIRSGDTVFGNLYLSDDAGVTFDERSEETLERFAALAAVAIENATLHQQVRVLAITEERQRIAREMHDSLAQVLGYVNTKVQATSVLLQNGKLDAATRNLDQMGTAARSAYADVREGILSLRTSLEEERGLVEALGEYLLLWQDQSGVKVVFEPGSLPERRLSDLAEVQLLRIVQEALTNVRKHAEASEVIVSIRQDERGIVTTVADNGKGISSRARSTIGVPQFGMSTMRERAEAMGGTLEVESQAHEGTTIIVRLPSSTSTNLGAGI